MGEPQVLPRGLPLRVLDFMGTSWGWCFLACSPIGIPGQGARGPQGWHLPQYLGMGAEAQHRCHPSWDPLLRGRGPYWVALVTLGIFPDALRAAGGRELGSTVVECFPKSASIAASAAATSSLPGRGDGGHAGLGTPL